MLQFGVGNGNGVVSVPYSRLPAPGCRNDSDPLISKCGVDASRGAALPYMRSAAMLSAVCGRGTEASAGLDAASVGRRCGLAGLAVNHALSTWKEIAAIQKIQETDPTYEHVALIPQRANEGAALPQGA